MQKDGDRYARKNLEKISGFHINMNEKVMNFSSIFEKIKKFNLRSSQLNMNIFTVQLV